MDDIQARVINKNLIKAMELLRTEIRKKLIAQGHSAKGNSPLHDDIDIEFKTLAFGAISEMYLKGYFRYVERGVKAANIPFGGTGKGGGKKTSKYIQGLIRFFKRKGLGDKEARSASFATARKHKKEGMPTRSSFKYSKDGTRLGFINSSITKLQDQLVELVTTGVSDELTLIFNEIVDDKIRVFDFTGN